MSMMRLRYLWLGRGQSRKHVQTNWRWWEAALVKVGCKNIPIFMRKVAMTWHRYVWFSQCHLLHSYSFGVFSQCVIYSIAIHLVCQYILIINHTLFTLWWTVCEIYNESYKNVYNINIYIKMTIFWTHGRIKWKLALNYTIIKFNPICMKLSLKIRNSQQIP